MRLKAIHRIEGKEVVEPGAEFDSTDEAGKRLISLGAAMEIKTPKDESKTSGAGASTQKLSAEEAIAKINECKTIEEVKVFFKGEERVTVVEAARAKIKMLKDAEKK
ncbi:MAG: hypothetical protein FD156_1218 [Nitrospirae bacterium]|nr:MAG: hypothetical protein FD156_1218 [Nitrospirota bacterium]